MVCFPSATLSRLLHRSREKQQMKEKCEDGVEKFSWLALSGADAPAPPKGEPLAVRKSLRFCQGLSLWERWHCVSNDGEGEAAYPFTAPAAMPL